MWLRIKGTAEEVLSEWGSMAIVVLLGLASFGLGRLSALEGAKPPVSVREAPVSNARVMTIGGEVVASRSGSAYHYPWCA